MFVKLLGSPGIEREHSAGVPLAQLGAGKPLVLVARLVVEARGLSRQAIADFLWPYIDHHKARASVRQALYVVRRALGEDALVETRDRVSVSPGLRADWRDVQQAVDRRDDASLVQAYGGPFLENVPPLDVIDVDQWIDVERARLLRLFTRATMQQAQRLLAIGDGESALRITRKLRLLHPMEAAHWGLLLALVRDLGDSSALAEEYEALVLRVSASGITQPQKAGELLAEFAALAGEAGARALPYFSSAWRAGWHDADEPEDEGKTVVTLFQSLAYSENRPSRQVPIGHPPGIRVQGDGSGLVATLLNHCGIPMPAHPREWASAVQLALESLRGVPHGIRLQAHNVDDGMAIAAIHEAAQRSRGTCLLLEMEVDAKVPAVVRAWQEIMTAAGR